MKARRTERFILRMTREERKTLGRLATARVTTAAHVIRKALKREQTEAATK
jgi:hypothetical protein